MTQVKLWCVLSNKCALVHNGCPDSNPMKWWRNQLRYAEIKWKSADSACKKVSIGIPDFQPLSIPAWRNIYDLGSAWISHETVKEKVGAYHQIHGRRHRGGGGGWETGPPQTFQRFITLMPMGGAWKESTSNDPRPPNRRAVTPPLLKANHRHTTHTRTVKIGNLWVYESKKIYSAVNVGLQQRHSR